MPEGDKSSLINLFTEVPLPDQESKGVIEKETKIGFDLEKLQFQKIKTEDNYEYTSKTSGGFFRLSLKCPEIGVWPFRLCPKAFG